MKSHGFWRLKLRRRFPRRWGIRILLCIVAMTWLAIIAASWAQADDSDEYNFNWLDPEKKIYVLQNRKYTKAGHLMVSLLAGPGISNPYKNSAGVGGRLGYYFQEWIGVEGFYTYVYNSDSKTLSSLGKKAPNVFPIVRDMISMSGINAQFIPWYAKINVFNRILYFDWYFNVGAGQLNTRLDKRDRFTDASAYINQNFTSLFLGTGHIFHLSQTFSARLDFQGAFYKAMTQGDSGDSVWFSDYTFGFGVGLKL